MALFDQAQIDLLREALGRLGTIAAAAHTPGRGESRHRVLRSRVTARLSVALSLAAPLEERLALSEEAVALVRPGSSASERAALASALAAHCDAIAGPADAERRAAESGEIVALATALDDRPMEMLGRRLRLVALLEMGDMAAVDAEIDAFALVAGRLRQPLYDWYVPLWKGMRALMQGRIDDAGRLGREAADAGARVSSDNARLLTVTLEWFRLTESGRGADAWEYMRGMVGQDVGLLAVWQKVAEALLHAERGARDEARGLLDQVWPHAIQAAPVDSEWLAVMAQLTAAVASIGAHPVAAWAYDQILPHRGRFIVDGIGAVCHGSAERQLGVLAACLGRQREAAGHIEAALDANRRAGAALLVARTLLDGGRALGHTRWLDEAARAYRELGISQMAQAAEVGTTAPPGAEGAPNRFRREGDVWAVTWRGETVRLRHVKGMADLARLLARPGREVAAADLVAGRDGAEVVAAGGDLGELIDDRARAAYQARLAALQAELDEADAAGDPARSARAAAEREALLTQLAAASGLGGRPRPAGGAGERARTAATWRIRDAIGRVEAAHPDLGRHLRRSVRTGTYCSYHPTEPTDWDS
ncbi:MAG TPA: hypothetical protein VM390_03060 [Acidimicrobiales bacterium]|nr:hypothetical protein [Acidimicrobiales bacterium]